MNSDWREALAPAVTKPLLIWLEKQPNKGYCSFSTGILEEEKGSLFFCLSNFISFRKISMKTDMLATMD